MYAVPRNSLVMLGHLYERTGFHIARTPDLRAEFTANDAEFARAELNEPSA